MGSAACERAAETLEITLASGRGDGLGYAIAGGLTVLEPLSVAERRAAVKAARLKASKAGGAASCKVCERAAEALEIALASGRGDGLGYAIAGGLTVLEQLSVAERRAAVKAAGLEASKAGTEVCERAARARGLFDACGKGDVVGYCAAGGIAVLEPLSLQERIAAVKRAHSTNARKSGEIRSAGAKAKLERVDDLIKHLEDARFPGLSSSDKSVKTARKNEREAIEGKYKYTGRDPRIAERMIDSLQHAAERALGKGGSKSAGSSDPAAKEWLSSPEPPSGRIVLTLLRRLHCDLGRNRKPPTKGKQSKDDGDDDEDIKILDEQDIVTIIDD